MAKINIPIVIRNGHIPIKEAGQLHTVYGVRPNREEIRFRHTIRWGLAYSDFLYSSGRFMDIKLL